MRLWLAPLILSMAASLATALFALQRRSFNQAAGSFAAVAVCHALWTFLEIVNLTTTSLDAKLLLAGTQWLAGLGMVGAGLWFACEYIGRPFRIDAWGWLLILPLPLILMLLGEPYHHRLHPEAWVRLAPPPSSLEYAFGWIEVSLITYGCAISLLACGLVLRRIARAQIVDLVEVGIVMVGLGLPPLVGVVSLALGVRWLHQRDTMPLIFGIADMIAALGLFRRRVFELPPLALEAVVDALADGVAICTPDGLVVDGNPALAVILGIPAPSILGTPASVVFGAWPELVAICRGERFRAEFRLDGVDRADEQVPASAALWVDVVGTPVRDWNGRIIGRSVVLRDVTAAKQASERRFQAIFDHTFELIALLAPDGKILEVNQTALAFAGIKREMVEGRPLWDTPWWAHSEMLREDLRTALQAMRKGEIVRFEATHLRCDSRMRYFDFSLTSVANDEGAVEYLIAEGRDVTELLHAQKENVSLADKLAHARRLESIGRMSAGIAHDFNNLLVAVMGSAQMAKTAVGDDSPARPALDLIERAVDSAARLTRQLLVFGNPAPSLSAPIDVGVLINRAAALISPAVGDRIAVTVESPTPLWPVRIDPGQLEQVLLNLAVNARDAMPDGGSLMVSAQNVTVAEARRFQSTELPPGEYVLIRLGDTGTGMTDAVLDRVFEPFFTTKTAGRGTGLGLSLVYAIVHGAGGFLEIASSPGSGTEVRLYLPRTAAAEEGAVIPSSQRAATSGPVGFIEGEPPCVLLIEDEHELRAFVCQQLTALGYDVHAFSAGALAETAASLLPRTPILLIADFVLPDSTGLTVADNLRRRWPALNVLFLSAFAASARRPRGRADVHFLVKPFDASTLAQTVAAVLAGD